MRQTVLLVMLGALLGCKSPAAAECTSLACLKDQERHTQFKQCVAENIEQAWDMEAIGMRGATGNMIQHCRKWSRQVVR